NILYQKCDIQYSPPLSQQLDLGEKRTFSKEVIDRIKKKGANFWALSVEDNFLIASLLFMPVNRDWLNRFQESGDFFKKCNDQLLKNQPLMRLSMGATWPSLQRLGLQTKLLRKVLNQYWDDNPSGYVVFDTFAGSGSNYLISIGFKKMGSFSDLKKSRTTNCYLIDRHNFLSTKKGD
ncbi:MAG: hypothetical protein U9Q63_01835, partial [Patescibacteria group bacterium]|nr:hypothetical protein [Patescibacteria group bacterium]